MTLTGSLPHEFLVVLALVLFLLAGIGVPESPRFRYIGWGLFCWLLSTLVR